ncbi:type IV pilin-like G/H family protein [Geminocystis sp. GBBB08]|uniref:type IV pilin protein n=1 Tax=Geminocystis sp. GBBB08 TaxID=2604140 RepID=UPI0027E324E9|nr:type IV pilin-like G/H family protein [Geminocystis sp. GBBB08]MBL1209476.1 prepilin-type N-terminal cleavage/methylation domain-containing protein [Geminocystis sp. GBBB08]
MKPEVTLKYLSYLRNKKNKGEEGFTLIELLVVVIIIGVLAAVALPNLLGQVGKARETEAKNGMGSLNRAQQAYHFEKQGFSASLDNTALAAATNALGVVVTSKYYTFASNAGNSTGAAVNATNDGVRNYAGSVTYGSGLYTTAVCQSNDIGGAAAGSGGSCTSGVALK